MSGSAPVVGSSNWAFARVTCCRYLSIIIIHTIIIMHAFSCAYDYVKSTFSSLYNVYF